MQRWEENVRVFPRDHSERRLVQIMQCPRWTNREKPYLLVTITLLPLNVDPAFWTLLCLLLVSKVFLNPGENWWPLIVKFWSILEVFHDFSGFFTGFPNALHQTMFLWWCEKSDYTTWESSSKSLTQRYAFSSCRWFSCSAVTMNVTLTDPKSRFRTILDDFAMFDDTLRYRAQHHPSVVVWEI